MATDKQSLQSRFSQMSTRQKATIVLIVIVMIILLWQIKGLFKSSDSTPAPVAPMQIAPNKQNSTTGTATSPSAPQSAEGMVPTPLPSIKTASLLLPPSEDAQELKAQSDVQKKYIDYLNRLAILKLEREIAETNSAIAAAKLDTRKSENDLGNAMIANLPKPVPTTAYSNALVAPTTGAVGAEPVSPPPPVAAALTQQAKIVTVSSYALISVAMQLQKWSAVIGYNGKLYNVSIGDILPDGSVVDSISRDMVVLKKDGKRLPLTIVSEI